MKKRLICLVALVTLIVSNFKAYSSAEDSVEIILTIPSAEIRLSKDLFVNIKIVSRKGTPLVITKDAAIGYFDRKIGFFRVQVQRKINGRYVDIAHNAAIDNMPTDLDTIYKNDIRKYDFPIRMLYHYTKGSYRVRILTAFSILNPQINDVYSNWAYFICKKEILMD